MTNTGGSLLALQWLARALSLAAVGVVLSFAIGGGSFSQLSRFTASELVLFAFFPLGVCLGMVVAWRWEGVGAAITIASLGAFYAAHRLLSPGFPRGFAFVALAAPGLLFLLHWLLKRSSQA
ncbi:MAG: hypothetical protein WCE44_09080 [Candidatus Velthaea sp.]|jgi:hypothetical protein